MADETEQRAFARPGFIVAAVVVGLLVVAGVTVSVIGMNKPDAEPSSESLTATTQPSAAPTESVKGGASVCGLETVLMKGTLSVPPAAEWSYLGETTFPISKTAGPGEQSESGMLSCFEHTPAGAVFFATSAVAQGSSPELAAEWLEYALVESDTKDSIVTQAETGTTGGGGEIRLTAAGFKLLAYDGNTARVDVGIRGDGQGKSLYLSMIYMLRWENGDWRLDVTGMEDPAQVAQLPNLAGYALWED